MLKLLDKQMSFVGAKNVIENNFVGTYRSVIMDYWTWSIILLQQKKLWIKCKMKMVVLWRNLMMRNGMESANTMDGETSLGDSVKVGIEFKDS